MNAYIIASLRSGIRDDLGQVFPGCQVLNWQPIKDEPTGKVKLASDYIRGEIADGTTMIPYTKVQTAIRVDRRNFRQLITSKDSWSALLEKLGLETYGTDKRDLGVKLRDPDLFGPRDDGVTPSQCHSRTL